MAKLTDEKIAELKALCEKATPGPWGTRGLSDHIRVESSAPTKNVAKCGSSKPSPREPDMEEVHANAEFIAAARTALPDLLSDLEEARRERDQYSLMFQNSDQHAKQLQQAYTDAISGRKAYCHLCHQFFEGHPDGHGLGECVAVCGSCFINATKKDDELCDSCKRAESAERERDALRANYLQSMKTANRDIEELQAEIEKPERALAEARQAIEEAEATLCACRRGNKRDSTDCNCDIHAARRILLAALPVPPEPTTKEQP